MIWMLDAELSIKKFFKVDYVNLYSKNDALHWQNENWLVYLHHYVIMINSDDCFHGNILTYIQLQ